mgnify:CR=1 FL=1
MRRFLAIFWVVVLWGAFASAQDVPAEEEPPPQLRAPSMGSLTLPEEEPPPAEDDFEAEFEEDDFDESSFDEEDDAEMAADDAALLGEAEPPAADPTLATWTNPRPVFSLNGYFRVRGEYIDNFSVRRIPLDRLGPTDPFARWIPIDNSPTSGGNGVLPQGGCGGEPQSPADQDQRCAGTGVLRYANMRLRLQPTFSLNDNVRLHLMIDAFDNLVLGSTPEVKSVNQFGQVTGRAPGVPVDSLTRTSPPPESFRNTVGDALVVRRAWGEITNSTIGSFRFGRMGHQWGLGMLWNAGEGTNILDSQLDSDFQSEVDRLQLIGKFKGVFFGVSWDFANKGYINDPVGDIQAIPRDASSFDDTRQFSFLVARRLEPIPREKRLRQGKWVVNGGAYFIYRSQNLSTSTASLLSTPVEVENAFVRRNANVYMPDGWFQALWKDLRMELEFAGIFGQLQNISPGDFPPTAEGERFKLRQWAIAFELEYRTLKQKLGVFLKSGVASGDPDVVGLSRYEDLATQPVGKKNISTFSFHPDYRIDLILWKEILGAIAGAYYLAPAISYDIIRSDFGRVFGARLDFIYSRAMYEQQTYSSEPNLGAEIDISVYYRTENGPQFTDGFFVSGQFGVLFPLNGLDYLTVDGISEPGTEGLGTRRALTMRLILGIQY